MRTIFSCLMLLCWVSNILHAQPLKFNRLGLEDGLSQSTINCIFQDSKGFMWFGSADGLNKYDGDIIKVYKINNAPQPLTNYIGQKIAEDASGDLWIGSRNGLNKYDYLKDKFLAFYPSNDSSLFDIWIEVLGIDKAQNLWFCNRSNKLFCYNLISKELKTIQIESKQNIFRTFFFDTKEYIWFNTTQGIGSYSIINNSFKYFTLENKTTKQKNIITGFSMDREGLLWMIEKDEIICFDPNLATCIEHKLKIKNPSPTWNCLLWAHDILWLGSSNDGLFSFNKSTKAIQSYVNNPTNAFSLATNIVTALFVDKSDNLWVASDAFGINKTNLSTPKFKHYYQSKEAGWNFSNNFIKCFYEDTFGRLWIGTNDEGINIFERSKNKIIVLKEGSNKENTIRCIIPEKNNSLLIGSSDGIKLYNQVSFKKETIPITYLKADKNRSSIIFGFLKTVEGTLLANTNAGLLEAVYDQKQLKYFKEIPNTFDFFLGAIHQSSDGRIWLSSTEGGEMMTTRYKDGILEPHQVVFLGMNVRSFYEDRKRGILYMGSDKGLICYELSTNKIKYINELQGMLSTHIYGLLCDEEGKLWMSSNKGLSCYNPSTNTCVNFGVSDGLQSNEFNSGAFYKNVSGEFFFGGIKGFNAFFPSNIINQASTAPIVLTRFMLNDEETERYGNPACFNKVVVAYSNNTLSFDFTSLDFTKTAQRKYRYKLSGYDKDWVDAGNKHFARYAKLSPGKYQFYVMASSNDGVWSNEVLLGEFILLGPWWRSNIAIGIAVLLILLIAWFIIRLIIRAELADKQIIIEKQKTLAQERSRISKDMHDDLGSGLTKISIMSELLKSGDKSSYETAQIEKISRTTNELIDNMSQIIWAMNPENDHIENILGYLRKFTLDFFEDSNIRCNLEFTELKNSKIVSQTKRRNLFLVIKESYHNILKHANANAVNVKVSIKSDKIIVIISDDGIGFDMASSMLSGNGLNNMNKRMREIGGVYKIKSKQGQGTETTLELPLK